MPGILPVSADLGALLPVALNCLCGGLARAAPRDIRSTFKKEIVDI